MRCSLSETIYATRSCGGAHVPKVQFKCDLVLSPTARYFSWPPFLYVDRLWGGRRDRIARARSRCVTGVGIRIQPFASSNIDISHHLRCTIGLFVRAMCRSRAVLLSDRFGFNRPTSVDVDVSRLDNAIDASRPPDFPFLSPCTLKDGCPGNPRDWSGILVEERPVCEPEGWPQPLRASVWVGGLPVSCVWRIRVAHLRFGDASVQNIEPHEVARTNRNRSEKYPTKGADASCGLERRILTYRSLRKHRRRRPRSLPGRSRCGQRRLSRGGWNPRMLRPPPHHHHQATPTQTPTHQLWNGFSCRSSVPHMPAGRSRCCAPPRFFRRAFGRLPIRCGLADVLLRLCVVAKRGTDLPHPPQPGGG